MIATPKCGVHLSSPQNRAFLDWFLIQWRLLQVTVKVMLYIMSLVSVDQKEQQMEVHGFYRTQWLDQRLAFSKRFEAGKNEHTPKKKREIQSSKIQNPKSTFQTLDLFAVLHFFSVILELFVGTCCLHDSVRGHEVLKMLCIEQVSMFCTYCWWWPVNSAITNVGCTNSGIFTINSTGEPSGFLFKIFLYIVLYFFLLKIFKSKAAWSWVCYFLFWKMLKKLCISIFSGA